MDNERNLAHEKSKEADDFFAEHLTWLNNSI